MKMLDFPDTQYDNDPNLKIRIQKIDDRTLRVTLFTSPVEPKMDEANDPMFLLSLLQRVWAMEMLAWHVEDGIRLPITAVSSIRTETVCWKYKVSFPPDSERCQWEDSDATVISLIMTVRRLNSCHSISSSVDLIIRVASTLCSCYRQVNGFMVVEKALPL